MQLYGLDFKSGMIFCKRESYELFFSIQDIDFGKRVNAKVHGAHGRIQVFNVSLDRARYLTDFCVIGKNLLIGFLSRKNASNRIEHEGNKYIGYCDIDTEGECAELDPLVVLDGYDEQFLIEQYLRLMACENKVHQLSEPYSVLLTDFDRVDKVLDAVENSERTILALTKPEKAERFLNLCVSHNLLPGVVVDQSDQNRIRELKNLGFKSFVVTFSNNHRKDVETLRKVLGDSIFIAKGISVLSAVGLVDGLIIDTPGQIGEFINQLLFSKVIRFYLQADDLDESLLKICSVLNLGVICEAPIKIEYAKAYQISKMMDQTLELTYLDKYNTCKKLVLGSRVLDFEDKPAFHLVRHMKIREDGRSFYFYREG